MTSLGDERGRTVQLIAPEQDFEVGRNEGPRLRVARVAHENLGRHATDFPGTVQGDFILECE